MKHCWTNILTVVFDINLIFINVFVKCRELFCLHSWKKSICMKKYINLIVGHFFIFKSQVHGQTFVRLMWSFKLHERTILKVPRIYFSILNTDGVNYNFKHKEKEGKCRPFYFCINKQDEQTLIKKKIHRNDQIKRKFL